MKNFISILTLCLLLLCSTAVSAEAIPEAPVGETQATVVYTQAYKLPADVPYDPNFRFDLTGQVSDQNDAPYSHRFMELHSQVRRVMTDEKGRFGVRHVEQGAHTLMALNSAGTVEGSLRFRIDRTNTVESAAILTLPDGTTQLLANARVSALHLILKLDGQGKLILTGAEAASWQTEAPEDSGASLFVNPPTGLPNGRTAALSAALLLALLVISQIRLSRKNTHKIP